MTNEGVGSTQLSSFTNPEVGYRCPRLEHSRNVSLRSCAPFLSHKAAAAAEAAAEAREGCPQAAWEVRRGSTAGAARGVPGPTSGSRARFRRRFLEVVRGVSMA
ncbi:unnamed protein product [Ectocarpus sp. CCAP 1310/34]|nr:unnamed protein product [Ectocarpus sp. CCAP 1310/34]